MGVQRAGRDLKSLLHAVRRHGWLTLLAVTGLIALFPVAYRATRVLLLLCAVALWLWGAMLVRKRKAVAALVLALPLVGVAWLGLPGRPADPSELRTAYAECLLKYRGVRYVWGGEGRLGIDCSGLVRRGLIDANVAVGVRTLNPRLLRAALSLWWHDCSARALRDEYRGLTVRRGVAPGINGIAKDSLLPGDLAVTADGVHVLACLGGETWIEADPGVLRVITVITPSENPWFAVPVQLVRWTQLEESPDKPAAP